MRYDHPKSVKWMVFLRFLIVLTSLLLSANLYAKDKTINIRFATSVTKRSINSLIKRVEKAIAKSKSDFKEVIISLDSPGGDIVQAIRAVDYMRSRSMANDIAIHTKVLSVNDCESSCTILFTGGEKRFAGKNAKFGFHSPNYVSGTVNNLTPEQIENLFRKKWIEQISSVDQIVAERIEHDRLLKEDSMSYLDATELQTGYVTDIL